MNVQPMMTYPVGSLIRLEGSFTRPPTADEIASGTACNAEDWQPVDPVIVRFRTRDPAAAEVTYTFGSDLEVSRTGVGAYVAMLPLGANLPGAWSYRIEGTGDGQAVVEASYSVRASVFT